MHSNDKILDDDEFKKLKKKEYLNKKKERSR